MSTTNDQFAALYAKAASSTKREGKYSTMLSQELNTLLDEFVAWLRAEDICGEASSRSYRTYMSKALALPDAPVDSNQRSAIKRFQEFMDQR
jgi:hypothetical protein